MDPIQQEILQHPFKPEERTFLLALSRDTSKDYGDKPIISVVGTDGSEDRHGSVINPDGWDMRSYLSNPVVLWSHNQEVPAIANTIGLTQKSGRWDFDLSFAIDAWEDGVSRNLAKLVYRLMKDDVIRATSVSFIPKAWQEREAVNIPSYFAENLEYTRQELTEISPVNIPSNRNALKKAIAEGVMSENEAEFLGLDRMLRMAVPIVVNSTPAVAVESRAEDEGEGEGGDEGGGETNAEAAIMASLSESLWSVANEAMEGFDRAEHDTFRGMCAGLVSYSLNSVDAIRYYLRSWHETDDASREITEAMMAVRSLAPMAYVTTIETTLTASESDDRTTPEPEPEPETISGDVTKIRSLFGDATAAPDATSPEVPATDTSDAPAPESTEHKGYLHTLFG